jgi:hypothetical protein
MKFRMLAVLVVLLACASISKAEISYWDCAPDGDGVITLNSPAPPYSPNPKWTELEEGEYEMTMKATHNPSLVKALDYGHMVGSFVSNGDPNVKFTNSIDNDTGETWTDYHINIYMDHPFSIVSGSAFVNTPSDWNPNSIITPVNVTPGVYVDGDGHSHAYEGSIDYYAGTPVPDTGTLEFGYKVNFTYSGTINFTQEMLPTPEPSALVLLACGLLGLLVIRRRFA